MSYERYLGDGVYASFDGFSINLAVGDHTQHAVALDVDVMEALIKYKKDTDELANKILNQQFGDDEQKLNGIHEDVVVVDEAIHALGKDSLQAIERDISISDVIEVLETIENDYRCIPEIPEWLMDKIATSTTLLKSLLK